LIWDLNHNISKKIVQIANNANKGIRLEKLTKMRQRTRIAKSFRYSLNNWPFYQLQKMIEYKAKLHGIAVSHIDPRYTSKTCSRCGHIGDRDNKNFKCPDCGHVDHTDANGSFNIGEPISCCILSIGRSCKDRDLQEGSTDTPKAATLGTIATIEPHMLWR
jgi:putative transposase